MTDSIYTLLFIILSISTVVSLAITINNWINYENYLRYCVITIGLCLIIIVLSIKANITTTTTYKIPSSEVILVSYTKQNVFGELEVNSYFKWKHIHRLLVNKEMLQKFDTLFVVEKKKPYQGTTNSVVLSESTVKDTINIKNNQKLK